MTLLPLAHAGSGATWQSMVVVAGVVLAVVVVAAAIGLLRIAEPDDLLVPVSASAIVASLGALVSDLVSDWVGWGLPVGVVSLLALLLAAFTPLDIRFPAPLPMGAIALAVVASVTLSTPLARTLHPPAELLPLADDSDVTIVAPSDGDEVDVGTIEVAVEVSGGSLGPGSMTAEELPDDPEEAGALSVVLAVLADDGTVTSQRSIEPDYDRDCTVPSPCAEVSFEVPVDEPGEHQLTVEFTRGDGLPLAPFVRDRVTFMAR